MNRPSWRWFARHQPLDQSPNHRLRLSPRNKKDESPVRWQPEEGRVEPTVCKRPTNSRDLGKRASMVNQHVNRTSPVNGSDCETAWAHMAKHHCVHDVTVALELEAQAAGFAAEGVLEPRQPRMRSASAPICCNVLPRVDSAPMSCTPPSAGTASPSGREGLFDVFSLAADTCFRSASTCRVSRQSLLAYTLLQPGNPGESRVHSDAVPMAYNVQAHRSQRPSPDHAQDSA